MNDITRATVVEHDRYVKVDARFLNAFDLLVSTIRNVNGFCDGPDAAVLEKAAFLLENYKGLNVMWEKQHENRK